MANITKQFLEEALGQSIDSFEINPGSNAGDGYTSLLYTIDVTLKDHSVQHILLKCYPAHGGRQEFLTQANIFQKELSVYDKLIPAFLEFQKDFDATAKIIKPPFPDFIYGRAINYRTMADSDSKLCLDPLENCIIMPDLRKTNNFRLANRLTGFDLDHCKLVIVAQAKVHALSWAYKLRSRVPSLAQKYSFLNDGTIFDTIEEMGMGGMFDNSMALYRGALESIEDIQEREILVKSLETARENLGDIQALYFCDKKTAPPSVTKDNILRVPGEVKKNEEPWLVACHGDCWLNNMLFRYDETTGKPVEVVFVDLQLTRESDPMTDLVYSMYTSTTSSLRKENLVDLLKLYCQTFIQVCEHFKVVPLAGFQLSEVQRRFHRAKAFGFLMSFMCFPIILNDPKNAIDLETIPEGISKDELIKGFAEMTSSVAGSPIFRERVIDVVRELHGEGVI